MSERLLLNEKSETEAELVNRSLKQTVQAIVERQAEPRWARERRFQSLLAFENLPMPSGMEESWRRTNVSSLRIESFLPAEPEPKGAHRPQGGSSSLQGPSGRGSLPEGSVVEMSESLRSTSSPSGVATLSRPRPFGSGPEVESTLALGARGGLLIQEDSQLLLSCLAGKLEAQGVIFSDLGTALTHHPDLVREHWMNGCVSPTESKFVAMNGAFWSGGVLLYVPAGLEISLPLQAIYRIGQAGAGVFPHTVIVAGPGSKAAYIEEYTASSDVGEALSSAVVEIFLGEGAQLSYVSLQRWGSQVVHLSTERALVGRDSSLRWIDCTLGGRLTKSFLEALLLEPGARVEQTGLFFGARDQHMDFSPFLHHRAPHTTGEVLFKGALKGKARSVFQGLIRVEKEARQTDSFLANYNLILSEKGRADSIPRLEIDNNDVRCSHAVTAGRVDEEQVFYLMSRGLTKPEATRLIVSGFFEQAYHRIPLEEEREKLRAAMEEMIAA